MHVLPVLLQEQSLVIPYYWHEDELWLLAGQKLRGFGAGEMVFPGGNLLEMKAHQKQLFANCMKKPGW